MLQAGLGPPPDIEFMQAVPGADSASTAVFVAMLRSEHLRTGGEEAHIA